MAKILIIDDEEQLRKLLARIIALEGYEVAEAADCAGGLRMLRRYEPDVVLCDVKLPDGNGVEMVGRIKQAMPSAEVILLTAYGNIPDGVQAIKNGAFDYITKGDDNNKILPLLSRATEKAQMQRRLARLEDKLSEEHSFDRIIGSSESLRSAVALARKVAVTDTSVLLTGETGTGKEVFAQAIHHASPRAKGAFVAVNCSAFSKELLESELFGHRAGSFTGATKDKKGLFEEADKGTLFLDEIGEMPVELQAKLLRVLECGEFIKIGETRPTKVDLRIIAATNRDLEKEIVSEGYSGEMIRKMDEKPVNFFASRRIGKYSNSLEVNVAEKTFAMLRDKAANGESFLIIGRCSDQVLKGNPNMLSIFICGNQQAKVGRVMEKKGLSAEDAIEEIKEVDRSRKSYHNYYCETKWGDARGYDMTVKSDVLGFEGTAKMLIAYIRSFMEQD